MSAEMKSENEVFRTLRQGCLNCLSAFGYSGVDVQRFAQSNMNYTDDTVLFHMIEHHREGWQWRSFGADSTTGALKRADEWIDRQTWMVETLKRMRNGDGVDTVTADDIAQALIVWFNGRGLDWLRTQGLSTLPIDPTEIIVYNDDSQLYQRRPVFMMDVLVPKLWKSPEKPVTALEVETYPV